MCRLDEVRHEVTVLAKVVQDLMFAGQVVPCSSQSRWEYDGSFNAERHGRSKGRGGEETSNKKLRE